MSDQPAARPECEHYWASHCFSGLSVRLCMLCHEPDWEDVRSQHAEAVRQGILSEQRRLSARLAAWKCPCGEPGCDALGARSELARLISESADAAAATP